MGLGYDLDSVIPLVSSSSHELVVDLEFHPLLEDEDMTSIFEARMYFGNPSEDCHSLDQRPPPPNVSRVGW